MENSKIFQNWLNSLDKNIKIDSIEILNKIYDENNEISYLKIFIICSRFNLKIPRYLYLKGYLLYLFPIIKINNEYYTYLIKKPFISIGKILKVLPFINLNYNLPLKEIAQNFFFKIFNLNLSLNNFKEFPLNNFYYPLPGPTNLTLKIFKIKLNNLNNFKLKKILNFNKINDFITKFILKNYLIKKNLI